MTTYPAWALETFVDRVAPVLDAAATDRAASAWVRSCGPGAVDRTQFRLFPGSLFLLWLRALGAESAPGHLDLAAALECLHNASLHHDDVIDHHDERRGTATARAEGGPAAALLAGDGLLGIAFELAASDCVPNRSAVLRALAKAWERMTVGQLLDEPASWQRVPAAEREQHWLAMTRLKLALGNVPGPLAAIAAGCEPHAAAIAALHEEFSIVSQIMNDVGDTAGWAGFHVVAACHRPARSEASRKPTIATIWDASSGAADACAASARVLDWATAEIGRRSMDALNRLEEIPVAATAKPLLADFFSRPLSEFERVTARAPDA
jgi:hypothetical protein